MTSSLTAEDVDDDKNPDDCKHGVFEGRGCEDCASDAIDAAVDAHKDRQMTDKN